MTCTSKYIRTTFKIISPFSLQHFILLAGLILPMVTSAQSTGEKKDIVPSSVANTAVRDTNHLEKIVSNGYFSWKETGNAQEDILALEAAARQFKLMYP